MADEQQALLPVVEHERPVDHQEMDGRGVELVAGRIGMAIEELRGLICEQADQAAGERWESREMRSPKRVHDRSQRRHGVTGGGLLQRQVTHDTIDARPGPIHGHDGRGITRHERVASPPFRALDGFEEDAGSGSRERREEPHGRGHVGQQLGPHRDERPFGGQTVERLPVGEHLQLRCHLHASNHDETPDRRPGVRAVMPSMLSFRRAATPGSASPGAKPR